jgi:hypothetical protein
MSSMRFFAVLGLLSLSAPAAALDLESAGVPGVEIHAFVSQGVMKTTDNNFLVKSRRGSFALTEVGINFTRALTDRLRAGVQLFGGGFVPTGQFNAKMDWFYLDYRWRDWLGIRAGRVKLPFGLYNEISDIDSARVPALLPQSTYPAQNRNFLLAQTGGEIYGYLRLGPAGAVEYRLYAGTIALDNTVTPGSPIVITSIDTPYVTGGRLMWETPVEGLRAGASLQALEIEFGLVYPMAASASVTAKIPAVLWTSSLEYQHRDLLLAAEYGRWRAKVESSNAMLFPPSDTVSERYYALAAYRLKTWLQVGAYYAGLFSNVDDRHTLATMQHDVAGTVRFDLNPHWLVKLEGHYEHGSAALNRGLNDNRPLAELPQDWGLFLLKTTAYF